MDLYNETSSNAHYYGDTGSEPPSWSSLNDDVLFEPLDFDQSVPDDVHADQRPPEQLGRSQRLRFLNRRYQDYVASSTTASTGARFLQPQATTANENVTQTGVESIQTNDSDSIASQPMLESSGLPTTAGVSLHTGVEVTAPNEFGLSKAFTRRLEPDPDPEANVPLEALCDIKHVSPTEPEYIDGHDQNTKETTTDSESDMDSEDPSQS